MAGELRHPQDERSLGAVVVWLWVLGVGCWVAGGGWCGGRYKGLRGKGRASRDRLGARVWRGCGEDEGRL